MKSLSISSLRRKQCLLGLKLVFIAFVMATVLYWSGLICNINQIASLNQNQKLERPSLPKKIKLIINNDICADDVFMIVIVHSATTHLEHRNTIRNTWAAATPLLPKIKVAFMLARPSNDSIQQLIHKENDYSHDIIQGDFVDSYKNLTYKHIMGLKWVADYCPQARFLVKMDDDIFVDIFQLVRQLNSNVAQLLNGRTIACYFQHRMPVVRDPSSKWYVSKEEFQKDTYDDYCSGWAYVTDPATARALSETAMRLPYFWIDDVHITGTVSRRAAVEKIRLNKYFFTETQGLAEWVMSNKDMLWEKIFAPTWGDLTLTRNAHRKAVRCERLKCKCCFSRTAQINTSTVKPAPPPTGKSIVRMLTLNKA